MKKNECIVVLCVLMLFLSAGTVFSQFKLDDLRDAADDFSAAMTKSLPFNSTLGLNWSDAYIGQFLSAPPHIGVGVSAGFTTLKLDSINKLMEYFKYEIPLNNSVGFPLLAYTLETRIGGFMLPFDIGAKFGYLNTSNMSIFDSFGVNIDYLLLGADIRFALIDSKLLPVRLSIGAGYNYLKGGLLTTLNTGSSYNFNAPDSLGGQSYILSISDIDLGLLWQTNVLELKAHVSFPLFIITPYTGVGASYSWAKTGYQVKSEVTINGGSPDNEIINILKNYFGVTDISGKGFESLNEISSWNVRVYGGLSLNLTVIKLDLTLMYNTKDSAFGGTFGARFQL
ncbi:MAG: hypothetical protein FWC06_01830 [Treponema sp.]|nr:hypothetical protein [Treponema sp.]